MGDRAAQGDSRPKRRYSAAEVTVAEGTPVQVACHVVGISESDWYAVPARPPSARSVRHALLTDLITQIHRDSRGIHGGRRVHAELTLGHGIEVGHGQVELLMRRAGLQGLGGRPRWETGQAREHCHRPRRTQLCPPRPQPAVGH